MDNTDTESKGLVGDKMENALFQLSDDWGNVKYHDELVVYGTGRIGRRVLPSLMKEFTIPFLIDTKDKGKKLFGLDVLAPEEVVERVKKNGLKILITTMKGAYNSISDSLKKQGLKENVDYCIFERFAQEWNLRWQNKCVLAKIDTVITTRCTLKCKNCNIFISHVTEPQDISFNSLKDNFDVLFDSVDYIYEYTLLGGEPFVHEDIAEILKYLEETYGNRIGRINIITNGTVVPNKDVLILLNKYNVSVHISDYTGTVPYSGKLDEVRRVLSKNEIEYYVIPNNTWKDIVYPNLNYISNDPHNHMILCGHSTHSVGNGRLYWCDPAYAADCFMGFPSEEDDYLDLKINKQENSKYDASINIFNYFLGNINARGYMSLCSRCAGIGSDNDRIIKAGEQVSKFEQGL